MFFLNKNISFHILRMGMAIVFIWFGFSQIFDSINWVAWVPEWASNLINLPPALIVILNGWFEIIFGSLLIFNLFIRFSSLILAIHLFFIFLSISLTPIGIRDFGLFMATLALFFQKKENKN